MSKISEIFDALDNGSTGQISLNTINKKGVDSQVLKIFSPVISKLQGIMFMNKDYFLQLGLKLF
mgnify:CR=1 FL=1